MRFSLRRPAWLIAVLVFLLAPTSTLFAQALPGLSIPFHMKDGAKLATSISWPRKPGPHPAVVLIHQGGSDRTEWRGFYEKLVEEGFFVLAFDVRGQGESTQGTEGDIYNDPNLVPKDLEVVFRYLFQHPMADENRIAIVGSSIGSNLAVMAIANMGIKSAVAISGKTSAAVNLAGASQLSDLSLHTIFHISSAGDQDGKRAEWARELYAHTTEPRQLEIVEGSSAHGVSIFKDAPELPEKIIAWLKETL